MAFAPKKPLEGESPMGMPPAHACAECCRSAHRSFGKKILATLLGVLVVYLIFYVGVLMRNGVKKFNYIGMADANERTIIVNGQGKVNGSNDIAVTSIGYSNVDPSVAKAQAENKKVMDAIMLDLKKLGVAEKDWQTDYNIYPEYNYTQERGQELKGYRVSNNVTVKIRDLTKIGAILGLAGKHGATQVGGLSFTIDDPENLKQEARGKALSDAEQKGLKLARALGVKLVEVVAYNEYESGQDYPQPMLLKVEGLGGGGSGPATIGAGSRDVSVNVSVTYKIMPAY